MNKLLVWMVLLLNVVDLSLSYLLLSPDTEANPLMQTLWEKGFIFVALFKVGAVAITFSCLYILRNYPTHFRIVLLLINVILLYTVFRLAQYYYVYEYTRHEIKSKHQEYIDTNPKFT